MTSAITLIGLLSVVCVVSLVSVVHTAVDTTWMWNTLKNHFSEPRHHVTNPGYKQQAKEFIKRELNRYGLETHIHEFPTTVPSVKGGNVIGLLKGRYFNTSKDRIVGLLAHYDTMRDSPGVDDNGGAIVAMLQAAKQIAKHTRNFTILVVSVDFEESEYDLPEAACSGLCGSERLVKDWFPSFWKTPPTVAGFIVMDIIMNFEEKPKSQDFPEGFAMLFPNVAERVKTGDVRGDFLAAIGRPYDSHILSAFQSAYSKLSMPKFQLEVFNISVLKGPAVTEDQVSLFTDLMRSDHYSLWKNEIPAIFLSDTANFRGYMKKCYHTECDDMSKVTNTMIQFAGKTAQALIDTVERLAPSIDHVTSGTSPASCGLLSWLMVHTSMILHLAALFR